MCKIVAMGKTIPQLFATFLDCEHAFSFWQAKRPASECASELAGELVTPPNAHGMTGKRKRSENNERKKKH